MSIAALGLGASVAVTSFEEPLTRVMGIVSEAPDDWRLASVRIVYGIALGAAAIGAAPTTSRPTLAGGALGLGFLAAAAAVFFHSIHGLRMAGVLLGLGWGSGARCLASDVAAGASHRRKLALILVTGLAVAGAVIARQLVPVLLATFASPSSTGVWESFVVLAVVSGGAAAAMRWRWVTRAPGPTRIVT